MVRLILFSLSCFLFISCLAQKQDRIWIFGDHAGIDFRDTSNVVSFYSGLDGTYVLYPSGSIADGSGNLLFYAAPSRLAIRSTKVFNRNDTLMYNGDDIEGHPSQSQGLLILPFPGDTNKYYILTKFPWSSKIYMYYSIVDMTEDSGLGAVVSKNNVFNTDSLTDRTTAVKHANGRDWWLLVQRWDQDEYLKYLITPAGFQGPYKQSTGNPKPKDEYYGTSYFSRSGRKLASVGIYGNISIMDFDRCTGNISNYQQIGTGLATHAFSYLGCAFSANENVLYVANSYPDGKYVYQYDLTAPDIAASMQIVCQYPDTGLLQYIQMGHMLLGADDKIYVAKGNGTGGPTSNTVYTQSIDVILNPDIIGPGCNYQTNHLYLNGGVVTIGLPNMVNYALGPVAGSICDSLSTGILENRVKMNPFTISPNPVKDWINIYFKESITNVSPYLTLLLNSQGQIVFEREMQVGEYSIPTSTLAKGVYVLQLKTKVGVFSERVMKLE